MLNRPDILLVLTIIGSIVGALVLVFGLVASAGALQGAAVAVLAVAIPVLPQFFARSLQAMSSASTAAAALVFLMT